MEKQTKLVLVDDHALLRNGLATLLSNIGFEVLYECGNGKELVDCVGKKEQPDVILMDLNMPEMDGFETTLWLKKNMPLINVVALSMHDDDISIIRMMKNGARGYLLKDSDPRELKQAIQSVISKGYYYSDLVSRKLLRNITEDENDDIEENTRRKLVLGLNEREITFLKFAATELTYKEIADEMHLSPRTIDGYREALFLKLGVKSRVGLVLFAVKYGIVNFNNDKKDVSVTYH